MIKKVTTVAVVALIAAAPTFSFAQGVAASLSASFGDNAGARVDVVPGTITEPTSISVAGAAGGRAVAGSVATALSTGAAAGAGGSTDGVAPYASVTYDGNAYELDVAFAEPGLFADLEALEIEVAALEMLVAANSSDIDGIQDALDDICSLASFAFSGTEGAVEVVSDGTVVTGLDTITILGVTVVVNPTFGSVNSTGTFTPAGDIVCTAA